MWGLLAGMLAGAAKSELIDRPKQEQKLRSQLITLKNLGVRPEGGYAQGPDTAQSAIDYGMAGAEFEQANKAAKAQEGMQGSYKNLLDAQTGYYRRGGNPVAASATVAPVAPPTSSPKSNYYTDAEAENLGLYKGLQNPYGFNALRRK